MQFFSMNQRRSAIASLLVAVLAGCNGAPAPATKELPKVTVASIEVKPLDDIEYFNGRTDAVDSVDIRARVTGYITKVKFKAGEEVAKDAPLFTVDAAPYEAEFRKAEAEEKRNESLLKEVLEPMYKRNEPLYRNGTISPQEWEKIVGDRLQAASALEAAKKNKERLKLNVDWCTVDAPIAGKTSNARVTERNLITADQTLLTTLVSVDPMYCYFDVDENTFLAIQQRIRAGKFATVKDAKLPVLLGLADDRKGGVQKYPNAGYIDFADNRLDSATGTLKARGVFDNPPVNGSSRALTPGLFARVMVPVGKQDKALWVPDKAVVTEQGKKFLYVVTDKSIVEARPVYLLKLEDAMRAVEPIQVVRTKDGTWRPAGENDKGAEQSIKAGERVIVSGVQRVRPGVQVTVEELDKGKKDKK